MAKFKVRQDAQSYGMLMTILDDYILNIAADDKDAENVLDISVSIDDSAVLTDDDMVEYRITADSVAVLFKILTGCPEYDISENPNLDRLVMNRDKKHTELQDKEVHNNWLKNCVAKYIADNENYTSKQIADLINENDLQSGMKPVVYQTIYRYVKAVKNSIS